MRFAKVKVFFLQFLSFFGWSRSSLQVQAPLKKAGSATLLDNLTVIELLLFECYQWSGSRTYSETCHDKKSIPSYIFTFTFTSHFCNFLLIFMLSFLSYLKQTYRAANLRITFFTIFMNIFIAWHLKLEFFKTIYLL